TILTLLIFFFNYTSTTHIYTLSLHDALPISFEKQPCASRKKDSKHSSQERIGKEAWIRFRRRFLGTTPNTSKPRLAIGKSWEILDRKSTRLNSSHVAISYAVFCLKKKNKIMK